MKGCNLQLITCLSLLHVISGFAPGCMKSSKVRSSVTQHRAHSGEQQQQSLQTLATSLFAAAALVFAPLNADALPQKPPESNAQVILLEALPRPQTDSIQALGAELGRMTSEGSGNIRSVDQKGMKGVRGWDTVLRQVRTRVAPCTQSQHPLLALYITAQQNSVVQSITFITIVHSFCFPCVWMRRSEL